MLQWNPSKAEGTFVTLDRDGVCPPNLTGIAYVLHEDIFTSECSTAARKVHDLLVSPEGFIAEVQPMAH
jgi:hypothetical protein